MRIAPLALVFAAMGVIMGTEICMATDHVAGNLIQFNENGAWCWYQDPRLVIDPVNRSLLISSIATSEGVDGANRTGDVDVAVYHFDSGTSTPFVLHHDFNPQDDHNAAALLIRPDGRYLAMYARHNHDNFSYCRVSAQPHDATAWGPEQTFDWTPAIAAAGAKSHVTYSNLFYLSAEKRVYDFSRAINDDPSLLISGDQGDHWKYAAKLLTEDKLGYVNGYTKYASNGFDRIDFITTEHHPRDFNNSIYHGFIQGGKLHRSDGSVVDEDIFHSTGHPQTELTHVFSANSMFDGEIMTHAWTISLEVDASGNPYGLISARANDQPENSNFRDHRFFYVRFDGKSWNVSQLARAGACLWPAEQDYTGLAALDPSDPNVVYVSTPIDPRNDFPLRAHEIFQGRTSDSGRTWQWTAITSDSSVDNLRPLAVSDGDQTVLVWFRGTMSRSQHYDSAMVGLILGKTGDEEKVAYLSEKSAIPNLPEGQYNIYAYFWSDPREDNRISAGLTPETVRVYRPRACQTAESSQFTQTAKIAEGNRLLYRAFLGRIKVDSPRSLAISVQDQDSACFAGVGYQPIE
jgi:BNR repeat-containing family member